ncbi:MAG: hypothetical protein LC779_08290 [Actinobacteria bacterium]|nr:hypothetical protein [Actinomycetota bacterium]
MVGGVTYALLGQHSGDAALTVVGASVAAASIAFAPWNVPTARVFLGDVGSYGLGAALAACAVLALTVRLPVEAAVAPLALYLADTGWTLLSRLLRKERWREPHRLHAYQRLIDTGLSHVAVSALVLLLTSALAVLGAVSLTGGLAARAAALAGATVLAGIYLVSPRLRSGSVAR